MKIGREAEIEWLQILEGASATMSKCSKASAPGGPQIAFVCVTADIQITHATRPAQMPATKPNVPGSDPPPAARQQVPGRQQYVPWVA